MSTSRLLKLECPSCGFIIRTTAKWLTAIGAPVCACPDKKRFKPSKARLDKLSRLVQDKG